MTDLDEARLLARVQAANADAARIRPLTNELCAYLGPIWHRHVEGVSGGALNVRVWLRHSNIEGVGELLAALRDLWADGWSRVNMYHPQMVQIARHGCAQVRPPPRNPGRCSAEAWSLLVDATLFREGAADGYTNLTPMTELVEAGLVADTGPPVVTGLWTVTAEGRRMVARAGRH